MRHRPPALIFLCSRTSGGPEGSAPTNHKAPVGPEGPHYSEPVWRGPGVTPSGLQAKPGRGTNPGSRTRDAGPMLRGKFPQSPRDARGPPTWRSRIEAFVHGPDRARSFRPPPGMSCLAGCSSCATHRFRAGTRRRPQSATDAIDEEQPARQDMPGGGRKRTRPDRVRGRTPRSRTPGGRARASREIEEISLEASDPRLESGFLDSCRGQACLQPAQRHASATHPGSGVVRTFRPTGAL